MGAAFLLAFWFQAIAAIAGSATLKLPCSAEGVDLSSARAAAISDCVSAAAAQLVSDWRVKNETFETERDVAVSNTATAEQEITGLTCIPYDEKVEEGEASVKLSLACAFDLSKVKAARIPKTAAQKAVKIGDQVQEKSLSIISTPPCESVIVQGQGATRVLRCSGNPFLIGLRPGDRTALVRVNGYPGQSFDLAQAVGRTISASFGGLEKGAADPILDHFCEAGRAVHRLGGILTFELPATAGLTLDAAAKAKNGALEDFRRRARLFDTHGQVYVDYANLVRKAVGASNQVAAFQEYFEDKGEKDLTPARAAGQGARLIAFYLKENYVLAVPPERISEVFGDLDHHTSIYRDLVRSFEGGNPVASRILELRQLTWDEALANATALEEKISEDGQSVTFQVNVDLKRLCPLIRSVNFFMGR